MNHVNWYVEEAERSVIENPQWTWIPGMRIQTPSGKEMRYVSDVIGMHGTGIVAIVETDGSSSTAQVHMTGLKPDLEDRATQALCQVALAYMHGVSDVCMTSAESTSLGTVYDYSTPSAYLLSPGVGIPDLPLALAFALVPELENEFRSYYSTFPQGSFDWDAFLYDEIIDEPDPAPRKQRDMTKAA